MFSDLGFILMYFSSNASCACRAAVLWIRHRFVGLEHVSGGRVFRKKPLFSRRGALSQHILLGVLVGAVFTAAIRAARA
jgi:hypothetical protein